MERSEEGPAAVNLRQRAARHAALGEPARLAIADELVRSDRSPAELGRRLGLPSNLVAHHLDVLEGVGLITRTTSAGDRRRRYVRLAADALPFADHGAQRAPEAVVFLCTANAARSQLAAAMWTARTGRPASSAGTQPAARVHRGAVAAARRAGLSLDGAAPRIVRPDDLDERIQVITVCDLAHESLPPSDHWWHWSIPDPVLQGDAAAFDGVVAELDRRIRTIVPPRQHLPEETSA